MTNLTYHQRYYLKNRERIIAYAKECHKKNKSQILEYKNARAKEMRRQKKEAYINIPFRSIGSWQEIGNAIGEVGAYRTFTKFEKDDSGERELQ